MQRAEITQDINRRFAVINRLAQKVTAHFDKQIVHELRVEMKKLRAFLELLRTENSAGELRIRRRLKQFNGYIGIIRNIQLQQHLIQERIPANTSTIEGYLQQLHASAQSWKKEVMKLLFEHADFNEEREKLMNAMPDKLSKTSIHQFLEEKQRGIQSSLMLQVVDENNLHTLRRLLKDLLYTWRYVKHEATGILPYEMNGSAQLQALTDLLGSYGDECTALDLLQPGYIEGVQDPEGRQLLRNLCTQLEQRKHQFRLDFFSTLLKQKQKPALLALE